MQCPACQETISPDVSMCPACGVEIAATEAEVDAPGGAPPNGGRERSARDRPQQSHQHHQPQQSHQTRHGGPSLGEQAKDVLDTVPWRGGIVAGVVIYVFGFAALAVLTTGLGSNPEGISLAAESFLGIVSFVAPSDLVVQVITPGPDTSEELLSGQYDGIVGLMYLIVPFLLYLTGRKFTEWNATDRDGVDTYLATGATVVFGTLPVAVGLAVLAGNNVIQYVLVAGLVLPALAGVFGSLMAWAFRSASRTASYGAGIFTGLLGYALVFVIVLASVPGITIQAIGLAPLLAAALFVFVNVTLFSVTAGGILALLGVALPVVLFGYFRASRGPDDVADPIGAARTGASLVAGFSTFAVALLVIYTVLTSPAVTGLPAAATPAGLATVATPVALLQSVLVAGVVFPVVFGGIGGAIAGYVAGGAGTGRPGQGRQPGPGGHAQQQPGQAPRNTAQSGQTTPAQGSAGAGGQPSRQHESPPPSNSSEGAPSGHEQSEQNRSPPAEGPTTDGSDDEHRNE